MTMRRVICPYCHQPARYTDSAPLYRGNSYGMVWLCDPCGAWVGCHGNTDEPLGRLANKELREWKQKAHAAFDPLWKRKLAQRQAKDREYKQAYARHMLKSIICPKSKILKIDAMKPTYTIHEVKDWLIKWEVHSSILNENAEFRNIGAKPDNCIAGFRTKEEAQRYVERCC